MNIEIMNAGRQNLNELTIIICGIVRSCSKNIKRNIPIINQLCDYAKDYHVIIFENDSIDKTKEILKKWSDTRRNVNISLNDFNTTTIPVHTSVNRFFSRARIEKMANYRNKYLEYIEDNNLFADYVIIVDLDVKNISLKGLLHSFGINQAWDAITANGYIYSPSAKYKKRYNDTYALVESGMENIPQTEDSINRNRYKWAFLKANMPMIRVFSAFGGLAIYKYEAIQKCKYTVIENKNDRVEVRCEHFSLHKQMFEKGYDKIFINPNMKVIYRPYLFDHINFFKRR